jgi:phosphatidylethanolamine-binding protein (PEBP) family uncharacterized protein
MTTRKKVNKIRPKKLNSKTKRNKTKRNKTKRNNTKHNKKKYHIGGQQQSLPIIFTVEYSGLGIIKPNQDLTGQSQYYNNQPIIRIQNANNNSLYLIIMYDPDAPNGLEATDKSSNHIYTHWVATINTNTNTNNNGNIEQILVKYAPPTPPKGTHRYIFNLYDITIKKDDLNFLNTLMMDNNNNNNDTRSSYYNNKLSNLEKSNPIIFSTSYTVKANSDNNA